MDAAKNARLDRELRDSFPASDPPSVVQPSPPSPARATFAGDLVTGIAIVGGVLLLARSVFRR